MLLTPRMRLTCTILQVVPVPGVGAIIAGWKNPHARMMPRGIAQVVLVVFGSWPLIIPGLIGFAWAIIDAVRIHGAVPPGPKSRPTEEERRRQEEQQREAQEAKQQRRQSKAATRAARIQTRRQAAAAKQKARSQAKAARTKGPRGKAKR